MKISATTPVLNECPWIGYSLMACLDQFHQFIYALDEKSNDGTRELLHHIKDKYAHEKLVILDYPTFHPSDQASYNASFAACIAQATGDACMFLHPDQIILNPDVIPMIKPGPMAWWVQMTSFAGDMKTLISKGRCDKWKNIHARKMGLHYYGGYGSQNEDFYHSAITGKSYKHFGPEFSKYPYQVMNSGIKVNHYCENKDYARRLEKMKSCLRTLHQGFTEERIGELAIQHPRVTLESSSTQFGRFAFEPSNEPIPDVFSKYKDEFESFKKELLHA